MIWYNIKGEHCEHEESRRDADLYHMLDVVGEARVSTAFLGIDHSFSGDTPVLWETMVFYTEIGPEETRYTSHEDAIKGHADIVSSLRRPYVLLDGEWVRAYSGNIPEMKWL
jgi:hypothetical protein